MTKEVASVLVRFHTQSKANGTLFHPGYESYFFLILEGI
jgi:hypothetical protein